MDDGPTDQPLQNLRSEHDIAAGLDLAFSRASMVPKPSTSGNYVGGPGQR